MKEGIVIGGSNGIGLAIAKELIKKGYYIHILDIIEPQENRLPINGYSYRYCNLLDLDETLIETLSQKTEIEVLFITAGFGRVAGFEYLHPAEIQNVMQVNAVSSIKILRYFYGRINAKERFYCGIMGSIAGYMSSPLFSVYSASKAAVCRFVESVNIELEENGTKNRILDVSPASLSGTKFNGGENDLSKLESLADEIIQKLFACKTLYIPKYEEVYRSVLERYHKDPHEYGIHSYEYKRQSGRVCNEQRVRIGYLSGTFDLFHVGHLNLLKRAKENCDYLIVGVHPDASHKGKETFIPFEERMQMIAGCRYVDKTVPSMPEDSDAVFKYGANRLFVGSDYKGTERFNRYEEMFRGRGIKIIYFPYTQGTSSTQIRKTVLLKTKDI